MDAGGMVRGGLAAVVAMAGMAVLDGAAADAETFKAQCGTCHARAASLARGLKGDTPGKKAELLDAFLANHHAPDAAIRKRIVVFLVDLAGR